MNLYFWGRVSYAVSRIHLLATRFQAASGNWAQAAFRKATAANIAELNRRRK